ncbi:DUF4910 domain-containing protein [candidate division KSB1 bacterium]
MKLKKSTFIFILLIISSAVLPQTEIQLLDTSIRNEFLQEISGIRAKDYVMQICQYNRTDGAFENTGYEKAVNYVMNFLKDAGVDDVILHKYLSDGTKKYGTWRSNPGFRVKSARLYMVSPSKSKWCDFSRVPLSLMPYSNGKGTDEAEVVYVGRGLTDKDYEGKEVKGKIVFADRADVTELMRQAVIKRGALGIIVGFSGSTVKAEFPTLVELNRLYLNGDELKSGKWGFSLSKKQTELMKRYTDSGRKVVMRAEVDVETFSGNMPIISALIKGKKYPDQEIIYMAHLDHYKPGANDNASGSAGLMEIAATLTKLINENRIPRPDRSIRFLWVPEQQGTMAYLVHNLETAKKGVIGINLDMIGEDYQKCSTLMRITRTPLSQPSFVDALFEYYAKYVDDLNITTRIGTNNKFNYRIIDYWGESDHTMFNDSQVGVPSVMVVHFPDRFWHTSFDTPEMVDPTELERSIFLGLFVGWTAANYDTDDISNFVELTFFNLVNKIEEKSVKYIALLKRSNNQNIHTNIRNIQNYYDILLENGTGSIESVLKNLDDSEQISVKNNCEIFKDYIDIQKKRAENFYRNLCKEKGIKTEKAKQTELENECSRIKPKRIFDLSIDVWTCYEIIRQKRVFGMNYDMFWEMINFANGENNLLKLRDVVAAQFREVTLNHVKALFEGLKERNLVEY